MWGGNLGNVRCQTKYCDLFRWVDVTSPSFGTTPIKVQIQYGGNFDLGHNGHSGVDSFKARQICHVPRTKDRPLVRSRTSMLNVSRLYLLQTLDRIVDLCRLQLREKVVTSKTRDAHVSRFRLSPFATSTVFFPLFTIDVSYLLPGWIYLSHCPEYRTRNRA